MEMNRVLFIHSHRIQTIMNIFRFFDEHSEECFKSIYGLTKQVFVELYTRYCGPSTPIDEPKKLASLFKYYKTYPVKRAFESSTSTSHYNSLDTYETHLASVIDELHDLWRHRFRIDNRLPHLFPRTTTGCIDTFPIYISRPDRADVQRAFYNGKYGGHVIKVRSM